MKNILAKIINNQNFAGLIFILPALLGTLIFIVIPVIASFGLSFTSWDLLNPIQFVGLDNYRLIFTEPLFFKILINTLVFAVATSVLGVIIPLVLAAILNSKIRGGEFYKTAYFLPFITPMIVIGIVWQWIFDPNIGILNNVLLNNVDLAFRFQKDTFVEAIMSKSSDIMTAIHDFQKRPILSLVEWKYQLHFKNDLATAQESYTKAISFASLIGDTHLEEQLVTEWQKDTQNYP